MELAVVTKKTRWSISNQKRDTHLKYAGFFDIENYKEMSFVAYINKDVDDSSGYSLYGDLTIKGITRRINLDVEFSGVIKDPGQNKSAIFNINGKINHEDWGADWKTYFEASEVSLYEDLWVSCIVQLAKQPQLPLLYSFLYSIYTAHFNYIIRHRYTTRLCMAATSPVTRIVPRISLE